MVVFRDAPGQAPAPGPAAPAPVPGPGTVRRGQEPPLTWSKQVLKLSICFKFEFELKVMFRSIRGQGRHECRGHRAAEKGITAQRREANKKIIVKIGWVVNPGASAPDERTSGRNRGHDFLTPTF